MIIIWDIHNVIIINFDYNYLSPNMKMSFIIKKFTEKLSITNIIIT